MNLSIRPIRLAGAGLLALLASCGSFHPMSVESAQEELFRDDLVRITTIDDVTFRGRVQDVDGEGVALHDRFYAYFEIRSLERWESGGLSSVGTFLGEAVGLLLYGGAVAGVAYLEVEYGLDDDECGCED